MLQKLAALLATALLNAAIDWVKDPANRDDIQAAGNFIADRVAATIPNLVDQATNATPWQWDDKFIDPLAAKLAELIAGKIPFGNIIGGLGGLLGGKQ